MARLGAAGVPVVYREYPMAHQVALESVQDAMAWLALVLAGERPTEPVPDFEGAGPEAGAGAGGKAVEDDGLVRAVTSRTFESEVLRSDQPVIVDFWAPWCQPCLMVAPIVEQIAAMRAGSYRVVKVNIDEEPAIADAYDVKSIPMIALFRGGRLLRLLGEQRPEALVGLPDEVPGGATEEAAAEDHPDQPDVQREQQEVHVDRLGVLQHEGDEHDGDQRQLRHLDEPVPLPLLHLHQLCAQPRHAGHVGAQRPLGVAGGQNGVVGRDGGGRLGHRGVGRRGAGHALRPGPG